VSVWGFKRVVRHVNREPAPASGAGPAV
jgi:hypothetical protein